MATKLRDRVQTALDESRILVLGAQVLLGFEYRAVFEPRFASMPEWARTAKLVSLAAMIVAFCLIVMPAAYHRIVARGEDTEDVNGFTCGALEVALSFFALGLGIDCAFAARRVLETPGALAVGAAAAAAAAGMWYAYTYGARGRHERPPQRSDMEKTELPQKVKHVLTEARMVLPGAQTLLGFQFSVMLMEAFDDLPHAYRMTHLAALGLLAVAIVLLMTPAAYHRIVERGEATEHFHRVASRLVLGSMVPLALAICLDLLVVVRHVTDSPTAAVASATAAAVFVLGMWFGVTTLIRRARDRRAPARPLRPAAQQR